MRHDGRGAVRRLVARLLRAAETRFPSWFPLDLHSYSQQGEDLLLLELLPGHAPPFFVDVGAHHPVRNSDTYLLHRLGWRGIAVEGDPQWEKLWRRHRPRDRFVCAVVDAQPGPRPFFLQGDQSTLRPEWAREGTASVQVDCTTLEDLLATHVGGEPIGLLKIDTEGTDLDLLESIDIARWRPCTVLVETHHWTTRDAVDDPRIVAWCRRAGYEVVAHNRRNLLLADSTWLGGRFRKTAHAYEALNPVVYRRQDAPEGAVPASRPGSRSGPPPA